MKKRMPLPSVDRIKKVLSYDPETGVFHWIKTRSNRVKPGDVAGYVDPAGYRTIRIDGFNFMAHRLAWKLVYRNDPGLEIDHINRIKDDNAISNLRAATRSQNRCNVDLKKGVSSQYRGVYKHPQSSRWRAEIGVNKKRIILGSFDSEIEAHEAYKAASKKYHVAFSPY